MIYCWIVFPHCTFFFLPSFWHPSSRFRPLRGPREHPKPALKGPREHPKRAKNRPTTPPRQFSRNASLTPRCRQARNASLTRRCRQARNASLTPRCRSRASICFFISFRNLLESILSSRTASPSFKNNGFTIEILTFLKNQRFRPKNCFKKVLELCRAPFGSS